MACLSPQEYQAWQDEEVAAEWGHCSHNNFRNLSDDDAKAGLVDADADESQWDFCASDSPQACCLARSPPIFEEDWADLSCKGPDTWELDSVMGMSKPSMIFELGDNVHNLYDRQHDDSSVQCLGSSVENVPKLPQKGHFNCANTATQLAEALEQEIEDHSMELDCRMAILGYVLAKVVLGLAWRSIKAAVRLLPYIPLFSLWQQLVIAVLVSILRLVWRFLAIGAWAWRVISIKKPIGKVHRRE